MEKTKGKRHPWHDVSPGEHSPDEVTAVIECPKGTNVKYELDKETGFIKLDRVLYSAVHYPGDYGFIPQTYYDDGDPIDIIILSNFPVYPRVLVKARPIGVLEMYDDMGKDYKIIAVHANDPRFDRFNNITDVSESVLNEIRHFFETYKELQNKHVEIKGVKGLIEAKAEIMRSIQMYKDKFLADEK